ncbi:MAG TPA: DinB family protein [Anaerolineales bacterium]|nr:DinB family protein [Anaerolineales bacterium]
MSEASHLADALSGLYSAPDHGWFVPITVSTAGLSAEQASRVPGPRFNSVWGVLNHVRFWQEYALLRLQGQEADRTALGADDGWPPPPSTPGDDSWEADCQRALVSNRSLTDLVGSFRESDLGEPYAPGRPARYQLIHGIIAHNCYHACEIISIRHMLGLWLERT